MKSRSQRNYYECIGIGTISIILALIGILVLPFFSTPLGIAAIVMNCLPLIGAAVCGLFSRIDRKKAKYYQNEIGEMDKTAREMNDEIREQAENFDNKCQNDDLINAILSK